MSNEKQLIWHLYVPGEVFSSGNKTKPLSSALEILHKERVTGRGAEKQY